MTNWPLITHLRADPYEEMWEEGEMGYLRWFGDNMWLFVPIQAKLKEFKERLVQKIAAKNDKLLSEIGKQ